MVIATFPRIYDSPDILEELATIWAEDFKKQVESKINDVDFIMTRSKEIVCRLYPIFFSEEFKDLVASPTSSSAGDIGLVEKRKKLLQSALRFGAIHQVKTKVSEAPYDLTVFKPFNVRELEYDVWDTSRSKSD